MILGNRNHRIYVHVYLVGLLLLLSGNLYSADLITGLGGDSGYGELAMTKNDDGSSAAIDISPSFPNGINFFGHLYTSLYINNNGNITFNRRLGTFTPAPFPISSQPMIAPYWGDVDTRGSSYIQPHWNRVYYAFPDDETMIITWHMVGVFKYYNLKLNDFQLILRRRTDTGVGNLDVEFRYNQLEWTTGDASGGLNGLGGTPAQVGFDAGDRINYYAHPDSRTDDILNLVSTSNVDELGVWRFLLREGGVSEPEDTLRDVVAKLFIPVSTVSVDTTSYTTVPNSDVVSGDTRVLTWNYDTISAGEIKDLSFDLDLINPTPSASEVVAYRFELDYIDVNDQPVHTELGEYKVQVASTRFEVSLNSDKTVYAANSDVTFTSMLKNLGDADANVSWSINIKDAQGILIETVQLTDVASLLSQSTTVQQPVWNTKSYVSGQYLAELVAVDSVFGTTTEATHSFTISPSDQSGDDQLVLAIAGSTDKPQYHTTDTVESQVNVMNESVNTTFNDATLTVSLIGPNGSEIANQSQDLYNLVPGTIANRKQQWTLDKAVEGTYHVVSTVLDDSNSSILSTSVSFVVKEDPLRSVTGSISAVNPNWILGEQPQCTYELENSGTLPIDTLEYRTSVVRISSQDVILTDENSSALLPGADLGESRVYDSALFTVDHYACVLEHKVEGTYQLVESALFEILPPPIETELSLETNGFGRLLVLTDEPRECSALEDIHVELNWEKELSVSDEVVVRIYDENGTLLEVESITAFDIEINNQHPVDEADAKVNVHGSGLIEVSLSAPIHKLGNHYRVEVEAKTGWFIRSTKDWSFSTDCDRPLTIGEVTEDIHLLGFKLFSGSTDSVKDLDPYGPSTAPKVSEQNAFLVDQLTNAGIEFTMVHSAEDFTQEMRKGDYAAYALLSERPHLTLMAQKELREHVYDGSGLVVAGSHDKRNLFVETALGLVVNGSHPWATGLIDGVIGDVVFPFTDRVQTFSMLGAKATSEYTLSHDQLDDDWKTFLGSLPLASEIETYKRRASAEFTYGKGKSVFYGYDALAISTELGEDHLLISEFISDIQSVLRDNKLPSAGKEQAFTLTINNSGTAVTGPLTLNLPVGMELVGSHEFTGSGDTWVAELDLAEGETKELVFYVKLPPEANTYGLNVRFDANSAYGTSKSVQINSNITVADSSGFDDLLTIAESVKHKYWYEPHFYVLYADLLLVEKAIGESNWYKAQALLLAASSALQIDHREEVLELRAAISEQVRVIGKNI